MQHSPAVTRADVQPRDQGPMSKKWSHVIRTVSPDHKVVTVVTVVTVVPSPKGPFCGTGSPHGCDLPPPPVGEELDGFQPGPYAGRSEFPREFAAPQRDACRSESSTVRPPPRRRRTRRGLRHDVNLAPPGGPGRSPSRTLAETARVAFGRPSRAGKYHDEYRNAVDCSERRRCGRSRDLSVPGWLGEVGCPHGW